MTGQATKDNLNEKYVLRVNCPETSVASYIREGLGDWKSPFPPVIYINSKDQGQFQQGLRSIGVDVVENNHFPSEIYVSRSILLEKSGKSFCVN